MHPPNEIMRSSLWLSAFALGIVAFPPAPAGGQEAVGQDESLAGLWSAIAAHSPEVRAAEAEVKASSARLMASGPAPVPEFELETEDPDGFDVTGSGMRAELTRDLLTGRRRDAERALAAADVARANAQLRIARGESYRRAVADVAALRGWSRVAHRLAREDSLLLSAEEGLRARFAIGEARYTDVLRLRTERLRIQSERSHALSELDVARLRLESAAPGFDVAALLAGAAADSGAGLAAAPSVDTLLARSPIVAAADADVQRAIAEVSFDRAERRIRLTGGIGLQLAGETDDRALGPVLSAGLTLPFLTPRAGRLRDDANTAMLASAEAARAAIVVAVRRDLTTAHARYSAARDRVLAYDTALLRAASEEREAALAAYRTGELSLVEFLDFERALSRAEIDRITAEIDAAAALSELLVAPAGNDSNPSER